MNTDIIQVKQLPVIVEQLRDVKAAVTARTAQAMSLVCTEESLRDIKAVRAALNKEFSEWESKRKEVKKSVTAPYEAFEAVYADCVSNAYKEADSVLKGEIHAVENALREQKVERLREKFDALCGQYGVPFATLEQTGIKVTLSSDEREAEKQMHAFLERIRADLTAIEAMGEDAREIRYEYEKSLSLAGAVQTVKNRKSALLAATEKQNAAENALQTDAESDDAFFAELFESMDAEAPQQSGNSAQTKPEPHWATVSQNPTGGTPVPFEIPKKEYTLRFQLTDEEWRALLIKINGFTYEVIRNDSI